MATRIKITYVTKSTTYLTSLFINMQNLHVFKHFKLSEQKMDRVSMRTKDHKSFDAGKRKNIFCGSLPS